MRVQRPSGVAATAPAAGATHLDLVAYGFCQVRVREEDVHKPKLYILDGLMEWVAMPFGMWNGPLTFQRMTNDVILDFLHKFVTIYLDDVYVYNRTVGEHLEHLRRVLWRFKEEGLKLRLKKCFFDLHEMECLGYTVWGVKTKKLKVVDEDSPVTTT
jgi:hypothetical protein